MKDNKPNHRARINPKDKSALTLTFQRLLKVIAIGCIVVLGYAGFQFAIIQPDRLYNELFVNYILPDSQKVHFQLTTLDSLYLEKNYQGVIGSFQSQETQSELDYFLTAISYMQNEQYEQAILLFLQLQQTDLSSNSKHNFQEETDYYLALAYLKAGQIENALTLFEQIYAQPHHVFSSHVSQLTLWKLKFLKMKQ